MAFLSRDSRNSRVGVPKSRPAGLPRLWSPITLRPDLGSKCGLKQSCSSRWELSNGMSHVFWSQVFRVDSRLFLVGSQIGTSTPGPSFGHNLCFRCPNEQCEPILDIYVPRAFQWYKERHKTLSFDSSNCSLKFRESTGTPSPKAGVALGVWGFTPSHFPTLPGVLDVTPGLPFGPHPCNPFALVASPKLGLRHFRSTIDYPSLGVFQVRLNKHFIDQTKTLLDSKTLETLMVSSENIIKHNYIQQLLSRWYNVPQMFFDEYVGDGMI